MARVHNPKKSNTGKPVNCGRCGATVNPGEKYYWWAPFFGSPKQFRCNKHFPRTSELTTSDKLSRVYSIAEEISDRVAEAGDNWDMEDVIQAVNDGADTATEVSEEYRESASAMEDAFPGGSPNIDECNEKADTLETYHDELESLAGELETEWEDLNGRKPEKDSEEWDDWESEFHSLCEKAESVECGV